MKLVQIALIALVLLAIIILVVFGIIKFSFLENKPLTDAECAKYLDGRVSVIEFGRSVTSFSKGSAIFPAVESDIETAKCPKKVTVVLLDDKGNNLKEVAYNLPPNGQPGGETGYGDYNENKSLAPGNYVFEFYYGDVLFKTINIQING